MTRKTDQKSIWLFILKCVLNACKAFSKIIIDLKAPRELTIAAMPEKIAAFWGNKY